MWTLLTQRGDEFFLFIGATLIAALLLRRRRWVWASIVLALGLLWVVFLPSMLEFLRPLGADSFAETENFSLDEALFWLHTLQGAIKPAGSKGILLIALAAALLVYLGAWWIGRAARVSERRRTQGLALLAILCVVWSGFSSLTSTLSLFFKNSESFAQTSKNFNHPLPAIRGTKRTLDLVVYIGESSSSVNFQIYGYARPTTPELKALAESDPGVLVFRDVFATHTHTSPSLLEALSLGIGSGEEFLPINRRNRVSLIDVLGAGGVQTMLLSNQARGGAWDQAGSILFRNTRRQFSTGPSRTGGADRPFDHEFFDAELDKIPLGNQAGARAVFLHAYGGHGPYLEGIPEAFRKPVDSRFATAASAGAAGSGTATLEAYDSAMRYVDFGVAQVVRRIERSATPTVMIYFSDHGENVFEGKGHDSARFMHEMARIPFIMVFNSSARAQEPALFRKYQELSRSGNVSTLAQLASTILDVAGVGLDESSGTKPVVSPVMGAAATYPPILVRETADGSSTST